MDSDTITQLPKALLHDHLDGGVRPLTVLELASETGYGNLPSTDARQLEQWFFRGGAGSLEGYLAAFTHTIGVMQTPASLERVAYECVTDMAADGVVYLETRFGPSLHTAAGMGREEAIEAVLAGLKRGADETGTITGIIVDALRDADDSVDVARAACRYAGQGVVGFDLSGPEAGNPADRFVHACRLAREHGLGITIHAGEGDGPRSIWSALNSCGADRIGHGVRIIEDTVVQDGDIVKLGALARSVRDRSIPLELCITSNLHTGIAATVAEHPFGALWRAGFAVTLNTDNRLMSRVTLTSEMGLAADTFGLSVEDLGHLTIRAIESGFADGLARRKLVDTIVRPAYAAASAIQL